CNYYVYCYWWLPRCRLDGFLSSICNGRWNARYLNYGVNPCWRIFRIKRSTWSGRLFLFKYLGERLRILWAVGGNYRSIAYLFNWLYGTSTCSRQTYVDEEYKNCKIRDVVVGRVQSGHGLFPLFTWAYWNHTSPPVSRS